jgi:cytochrome bd ubiquinol oxidase subunit I
MGLAWLLVYWKSRALRTGDEKYNRAARFWDRIFGLNFAVGVVAGIPMEFQFGTNWAGFSKYSGAIIGQTLAMEACSTTQIERSESSLCLPKVANLCEAVQSFGAEHRTGNYEKRSRRSN